MHELSIARAVIREVTAATGDDARRVRSVQLSVGRLSGIVSDALAYGWPFACAGTPLEGAELQIDDVDVVIWCSPCGTKRTVAGDGFTCPVCGTASDDFRAGRELLVRRVLLADTAELADAS